MASCPGNSIMHYHAFANTDVCWNTVHAAGERWAEWLTQWNWSLPSLTGRNQARSQVTANLKWGQEYFEVVTALTGDLTLRDATKPFNFLTFPDTRKNPADESSILMGFWILFPATAASPLVIQRAKRIIRQTQEKKQPDCIQLPFLLSDLSPCFMEKSFVSLSCVCLLEVIGIIT